jgi:uncharacterized DUF497 family protein
VEFEWDEDKALNNIAKHGIDFFDAIHIGLQRLALSAKMT